MTQIAPEADTDGSGGDLRAGYRFLTPVLIAAGYRVATTSSPSSSTSAGPP